MRRLSDTLCSQRGHKKADFEAGRDCESCLPYLVYFSHTLGMVPVGANRCACVAHPCLDSETGRRHRSILRAGVVNAVLKQLYPQDGLGVVVALRSICKFLKGKGEAGRRLTERVFKVDLPLSYSTVILGVQHSSNGSLRTHVPVLDKTQVIMMITRLCAGDGLLL